MRLLSCPARCWAALSAPGSGPALLAPLSRKVLAWSCAQGRFGPAQRGNAEVVQDCFCRRRLAARNGNGDFRQGRLWGSRRYGGRWRVFQRFEAKATNWAGNAPAHLLVRNFQSAIAVRASKDGRHVASVAVQFVRHERRRRARCVW